MTLTLQILLILSLLQGCSHAPNKAIEGVPLAEGSVFPATPLQDQFEKEVAVGDSTPWVLFSREKEVSAIVNGVLQSHKELTNRGGVYIADISAMPGLVTRLFALPKMRKYPYSVALDREGVFTKLWPTQANAATLFRLKHGRVQEIRFLKSAEDLLKELQ
jgi:hypothetical protein